MGKIIDWDKSIIPACDVPLEVYEEILKNTGDMDKIGGYKIGLYLMLLEGLKDVEIPDNALYNHRSGATDIPDMGKNMLSVMKDYPEIKGIIMTPLSGPATQEKWTEVAKEYGKLVFIEPVLDMKTFLESDGGYITDDSISRIIDLGLKQEVDGFILPYTELGDKFAEKLKDKNTKVLRREKGQLDSDFSEVTAYDVIPNGLSRIVEITEKHTDKPIIYDHQKAGTDIPDMGEKFAKVCKNAGVDAIILFPQSGPETEKVWIEAAKEEDLGIIVGGLMTHPKYVRSEGGYLADEAVMRMYLNGADLGVTDFVVPGNKPDDIKRIKETLEERGISPTFYAPGFVAQGGEISDAAKVAGKNWHAIVGRGIYESENIRQAALEYTSNLIFNSQATKPER